MKINKMKEEEILKRLKKLPSNDMSLYKKHLSNRLDYLDSRKNAR